MAWFLRVRAAWPEPCAQLPDEHKSGIRGSPLASIDSSTSLEMGARSCGSVWRCPLFPCGVFSSGLNQGLLWKFSACYQRSEPGLALAAATTNLAHVLENLLTRPTRQPKHNGQSGLAKR